MCRSRPRPRRSRPAGSASTTPTTCSRVEPAAPRVRLAANSGRSSCPTRSRTSCGSPGPRSPSSTPAAGRGRRVPPPGGPAPRAAPAVRRLFRSASVPVCSDSTMDGPGLRPGRAAPQPPLKPRLRGRLRDDRLLAGSLDRAPRRRRCSTVPSRCRRRSSCGTWPRRSSTSPRPSTCGGARRFTPSLRRPARSPRSSCSRCSPGSPRWSCCVTPGGSSARPATCGSVVSGVSLAFTILPDLAVSARKHHHPSQFADPILLSNWLHAYDPETRTLPVWSTG